MDKDVEEYIKTLHGMDRCYAEFLTYNHDNDITIDEIKETLERWRQMDADEKQWGDWYYPILGFVVLLTLIILCI